MGSGDWSDRENDLIVADYFAMLHAEISGSRYAKAEHRRHLKPMLNQRSEGSIEFKHQNISAVLLGLGQPWIDGYKPASRFQGSLVEAVLRWLDSQPGWLSPATSQTKTTARHQPGFAEDMPTLWIGPPPTFSNEPPPIDPAMSAFIARKYDVAERDARNRALGQAGEELILTHERQTLRSSGRRDLAEKVRWVSRDDGDGAGYDIGSFEPDGRPRLIEVKTTNGWERTPFHITRNELAVADLHRSSWELIRVWDFARQPKAFAIHPPLDAHVSLTPTSFLASLQ
jgi:hypothetical protein